MLIHAKMIGGPGLHWERLNYTTSHLCIVIGFCHCTLFTEGENYLFCVARTRNDFLAKIYSLLVLYPE